jgi:hypothetical protein
MNAEGSRETEKTALGPCAVSDEPLLVIIGIGDAIAGGRAR